MKNNFLLIVLFLCAGSLFLFAKRTKVKIINEGNVAPAEMESRVENLAAFHSITIAGEMDAEITQSDAFSVEIRSNQLEKIESVVKDSVLVIFSKKTDKNFKGNAYISAPQFRDIKVSGASSVKATNTLAQPSLSLSATGASNVEINANNQHTNVICSGSSDMKLNGDMSIVEMAISGASDLYLHGNLSSLKAVCTGSSDVDISGHVQKANITVSGSSDFNGEKCEIDHCNVVASGSSDAAVNVKNTLSVTASGSSEITYYGNPKVEKNSISGSSSIIQKSK